MPPRKVIDTSKYHDKKEAPKLVIPEVRITPHIRIREGLWEHIAEGKLTLTDYCVYSTLLHRAKWGTGICITSAGSVAGNWGGQMKLNTAQVSLGRLRDNGYIKYPEGTGKRGVYPVLIDKYEPQVGPCKGWSLNAAASDDYDNPVYDYVSSTPYGEAYGESAVRDAVRVWRVSGAPYGLSAGDWAVRQPLQAVIQLSSQAGQALPSNQSVNHSSLGGSEDEIKFLDVNSNQTEQTTPSRLDEEEDELG
jgi:hypothetical protein